MKYTGFLLLTFLCCSYLAIAQSPPRTHADSLKAPRFKFASDAHDFGAIPEGTPAEYTFTFKNVGKLPLVITNCSPSGGNFLPDWDKAPVLPGKTGRIHVMLPTSGCTGFFQKSIYIQSNALTQDNRYELSIKGTVIPDAARLPRFEFIGGDTHNFGNIPAGPQAECFFVFKNVGNAPLVIQSCSSSSGGVVPEWEREPVLPGKKGRIKVSMYTEGRSGPFHKTVYIQSNAPSPNGMVRYEIYIKGKLVDDTANGPVIYFFAGNSYNIDSIPPGQPVAHTFRFKNAGRAPLIIERCSDGGDWNSEDWIKTPILPGDTGWVKIMARPQGHFVTNGQSLYISSNYHGANNYVYITGTLPMGDSPDRNVPYRKR